MSVPARPDGSAFSHDESVAMGFLAGYSEPTRSLYGLNLRQWFTWCRDHGVKPLDAQRPHIEVYARLAARVPPPQGVHRVSLSSTISSP